MVKLEKGTQHFCLKLRQANAIICLLVILKSIRSIMLSQFYRILPLSWDSPKYPFKGDTDISCSLFKNTYILYWVISMLDNS